METKTKLVKLGIIFVWLILFVRTTLATPWGPTALSDGGSQRANFTSSPREVQAEAGNVTQLSFSTTILTKRWQGFYGNITGGITLDDAGGFTMYDWSGMITPAGEVYAVNNSIVDWTAVKCFNVSAQGKGFNCTGQEEWCLNLTNVEQGFGISSLEPDGLDETFNDSISIEVGTTALEGCPATHLLTNNSYNPLYWNETILTINNSNSTLIFAAQVEDDVMGFDNKTWDFQMMVLDNGDLDGSTSYFLYVELV